MARGTSTHTTSRTRTFRRSTSRTSCAGRRSSSRDHSASSARSRGDSPGGRSASGRGAGGRGDGRGGWLGADGRVGGRAVRNYISHGGLMRKATWFAAAAALLVGAGCASLGRNAFKEPVVNVKNVVLNGVGLQGGSIDVVLNVYNPNGYRLDATRLTYKLLLDTVTFATGALDQRFTVQDKDSIP